MPALLAGIVKALPPRRLLKEHAYRLSHPGLVVLQRPEIFPALLQNATAQFPLGVKSIPGNHPHPHLQLGQQAGGDPKYTLFAVHQT